MINVSGILLEESKVKMKKATCMTGSPIPFSRTSTTLYCLLKCIRYTECLREELQDGGRVSIWNHLEPLRGWQEVEV